MKLVLMGTNDWVIPSFDRLANDHEILAVFTRAPKPAGRKMILAKSPVHIWAESRGITVFTDIKDFNFSPDYIVVASYGVILRDNVLNAAPIINVHPSLLPKYRGASPMLSAILNGDNETGVCLINLTADVDAGDIYMCRKIEIGADDTIGDLEKNVSNVSADMLIEYFKNPSAYPATPQIGEPTFCRKFTTADTIIDWNKSPLQIHNQVRSIGGRTKINGIDVKILKTKVKDDKLEILQIQPAGKKPMDWKSFVNGQRGEIKFG